MQTYGVVIWGRPSKRSLIVWCADGQALAYAVGPTARLPAAWAIGDLVDIVYDTDENGRRLCSLVSLTNTRMAVPDLKNHPDARRAPQGPAVFARDDALANLLSPMAAPGTPANDPAALTRCCEPATSDKEHFA